MLSNDLQVHKDIQTLIKVLLDYLEDSPRFMRYTLGTKMIDMAAETMSLIRLANSNVNYRVNNLNLAYGKIEDVKSIARIFAEQKIHGRRVWDAKKCANTAFLLDRISAQTVKWRNATQSQGKSA